MVVVADAEVGKKINMRCPMRPELLGPGLLLSSEDNVLFERGILTVQECVSDVLGALHCLRLSMQRQHELTRSLLGSRALTTI